MFLCYSLWGYGFRLRARPKPAICVEGIQCQYRWSRAGIVCRGNGGLMMSFSLTWRRIDLCCVSISKMPPAQLCLECPWAVACGDLFIWTGNTLGVNTGTACWSVPANLLKTCSLHVNCVLREDSIIYPSIVTKSNSNIYGLLLASNEMFLK